MTTPLASADSLRIGTVDFVSPDEIKVLLDIEAPNDVSLNTGVPRPFPRINSYVLIPSESGFLVAQIEWITIERSQYPKRRGIQDFGVIDLPYPLRKMSLNPLGILRDRASDTQETSQYSFSRGIEVFPTVGDPVLLPTPNQLKSIVESGENRRVKIGVSPLAGNAVVAVDPDRLFGRHLAVLGNTGSGKSCSVAGVIRWSIEAVQRQNAGAEAGETVANTRFIILDPNGEYSSAFSDLSNVRVFGVEEDTAHGIQQLKVPLWLWNSAEWAAVTQASTKTQRPTLVQALRSVRDGQLVGEITPRDSMRRYLRTLISCVKSEISTGTPWMGGGRSKGFMENVLTWQMGFANGGVYTADELITIGRLQGKFEEFLASSTSSKPEWPKYSKPAAEELLKALGDAYHDFGGCVQDALPIDVDAPRPFAGDDLIRSIEANAELMKTSEYVETMLMRVRALLSDSKLKRVIAPEEEITLEQWMEQYICPSNSSNGAVTVLDLSLVPAELTHIVTSVVARMVLESLQRYRKMNGSKTLPTTIVMEEAHTFIKRYNSDNENATASEMCAKIFEKIAREGRKFGLGLILSSQRPSELSPTVLSQCNILSILQDRQPKEMALTCLSEERLNFLIQRRFLSFSENGEIIFSHESFALYIRHTLEKDAKTKKKLANSFFSRWNYLLEYVTVYEKGVLALWAGNKTLAKDCFGDIIRNIQSTTNHSAFNADFNMNKYLTHILNLFANESNSKDFLVKVIKTKIYTSIHHFSPVFAINDCDNILGFITKNRVLKNDRRLNNLVKQQKAHAMIIAGYMCDAELIMKELLSDWLLCKKSLDPDTLFDLFDRFCGVYIDLNCKDLAINYNEMSKEKAMLDNRLMALVYLNKAKIYFLSDFEIANQSLAKVQELLKNGDSKRILCSSKISCLMIELLHNKRTDYNKMIEEAHLILEEAFEGSYAHSIARVYLILAVLHLFSAKSSDKLQETRDLIDLGINYSIKFGFQREAWEFYNLLAIVQLRHGIVVEEIRKTFATAFTLLQEHDYLNLGMRNLCCDNILVLSNIGFFYQSKKTEKEFYEYMMKVTFWGDSRQHIKGDNPLPTNF